MQSKYSLFPYWENYIIKNEDILKGHFNTMPITKDSVFTHMVLVNCYGDSSNVWAYYPNINALLGLLQYIYFPTVFNIKLLGKENDEIAVPMCTVEELLEIAEDGTKCQSKEEISVMNEQIERFQELWNLNDEEAFEKLRSFSIDFNEHWTKDRGIFFYFDVYRTPSELGNYLIEAYEEVEMIDRLEEDLGLSKYEWIKLCDSVYENEFMRHKFVDILNNRIRDMV